MTKTNHLGQQTTDSGHVITESERIAKDLKSLEFPHNEFPLNYWDDDEIGVLTAYIMDYAHTDWSKNVRHGVSLGRKDAITMLKAAIDSKQSIFPPNGVYDYSVVAVPLDELQKIITALRSVSMEDITNVDM